MPAEKNVTYLLTIQSLSTIFTISARNTLWKTLNKMLMNLKVSMI